MQVFYCAAGYCLQCIVHAPSRRRMREKYGLEEAPFDDCMTTFLCAASLWRNPPCPPSAAAPHAVRNGTA